MIFCFKNIFTHTQKEVCVCTVSIQYFTTTVRNGFILAGKRLLLSECHPPHTLDEDLDKLLNPLSLVIFLSLRWR